MARSMTGYGVGKTSANGINLTSELRSVNNRFLDFSTRLPRMLYPYEPEIREICRKRIERGRLSVYITVEYAGDQTPDIRLDRARIRSFAKQLDELRRELKLEDPLRLEHLLTADDLFIPNDDESQQQQLWDLARKALDQALDGLIEAGRREAEMLCSDINTRIDTVSELLGQIRDYADKQVVEYHHRLKARLDEIIEDSRIDQNRIETEIALSADKLDISEEIVRLDSHLKMFRSTIGQKDAIGKSLAFILQEMSREANTITSKSWSLDITQSAIKIKELLEQIREQVQNIE